VRTDSGTHSPGDHGSPLDTALPQCPRSGAVHCQPNRVAITGGDGEARTGD